MAIMTQDQAFSLDEARDSLFKLHKAEQRFADSTSKLVDALNSRTPEQEWMLQVLEEAQKGVTFTAQQLSAWQSLAARAEEHVAALRREAELQAMQELRAGGVEAGAEAGGSVGEASEAADCASGTARTIHPELLKFKLEKQAKILGKYGGVPAIGAGLVLPRPGKDVILKATASPAAREIQYSRIENKDARALAAVMQFKPRTSGTGEAPTEGAQDGCSTSAAAASALPPGTSPWLAELSARKGRASLLRAGDSSEDAAPPLPATCHNELAAALRARQASLAAASERDQAEARAELKASAHAAAAASSELAQALRRRQSSPPAEQATQGTGEAVSDPRDGADPCGVSSPSGTPPPHTPLQLPQRQGSHRGGDADADAGGDADMGMGGSLPPTPSDLQPALPGLASSSSSGRQAPGSP